MMISVQVYVNECSRGVCNMLCKPEIMVCKTYVHPPMDVHLHTLVHLRAFGGRFGVVRRAAEVQKEA